MDDINKFATVDGVAVVCPDPGLLPNVICELEIRADELLEIGCAFIAHTETEFYVVLWS